MDFHYPLDFLPCHKDHNSSGLDKNAQRGLIVVDEDFALRLDFLGMSPFFCFLLLTNTPFH
jgi:hypothetical protein